MNSNIFLQILVSYLFGLSLYIVLHKNQLPSIFSVSTSPPYDDVATEVEMASIIPDNHFLFHQESNNQQQHDKATSIEGTAVAALNTVNVNGGFQKEEENDTLSTTSKKSEEFVPFQYFTNEVPIQKLIHRMSMANVHMGCHITTWVYEGYISKFRSVNDCYKALQKNPQRELVVSNESSSDAANLDFGLQPWDTIFVPIIKLEHFVNHTLDKITVPVIILSGMENKVHQFPKFVFDQILDHSMVQAWFLQNLPHYAGFKDSRGRLRLRPSKLHSWPYGIHFLSHRNLLLEMQAVKERKKERFVYVGHFKKENNRVKRREIINNAVIEPRTENQSIYYQHIHQSHYIVSPDGDRPECYRHYESIALNAKPLTQLSPASDFEHFGSNVIYDHREWNVTLLQQQLPPHPTVNQRLVFLEYWMEYVERIVQHSLQWFDPTGNKHTLLKDLVERVREEEDNVTAILSRDDIPIILFCDNCEKYGKVWG